MHIGDKFKYRGKEVIINKVWIDTINDMKGVTFKDDSEKEIDMYECCLEKLLEITNEKEKKKN